MSYTSNPLLQESDAQAEDHVAAIFDLPLRYDTDSTDFMIRPYGRIADSSGYASLASNYAHLDASAQFNDERGSTTLQESVARDSSLYYIGALVNSAGVARDTAATSADWARLLTERTQVQLDASWTRVRYDEPPNLNALVDYRYLSAGPTFSIAMSERDSLKLLGSYGDYQSLNGITASKSENLQVGFVRQLSEIWTASASAGYSKSKNSQKIYYFGVYYLGTEMSDQDGAVYSLTLSRQGEKFNLTGSVSRALQPSGFAYLSRQDSFSISSTYTQSEKWDFAFSAAWSRALNPQVSSGQAVLNEEITVNYQNFGLTANWHLTPQWIVSASATRLAQQYGPPTVSAASTGVSLNIVRQFLRTQFQ